MTLKAYKTLEKKFTEISHLDHVAAIANWDEATVMPSGGGKARSAAMATLMQMRHNLIINDEIGTLIDSAKAEDLDNDWQKANLLQIEKLYLNNKCIPGELVKAFTQASMTSQQAWRTYHAQNNWSDFAPLLKKTLELTKKCAYIKSDIFGLSPYDVLIDEYSPNINQAMIDPIFNQLESFLPSYIQQATSKQSECEMMEIQGEFTASKQKKLGISLMNILGFDFSHGRLDESHHPFCGGVPEDVRITTRYTENEFISSALAICHETGHALYERGLPKQWLTQPVGIALGMSVHESQSLLMEMQACQSTEFMQVLSKQAIEVFGNQKALSADNLYKHITRVKPGLIRVHADELTYPLHVIMRYKIEKQLIEDDLTIDELPDIWDSYMQKYLGLSTKGD